MLFEDVARQMEGLGMTEDRQKNVQDNVMKMFGKSDFAGTKSGNLKTQDDAFFGGTIASPPPPPTSLKENVTPPPPAPLPERLVPRVRLGAAARLRRRDEHTCKRHTFYS